MTATMRKRIFQAEDELIRQIDAEKQPQPAAVARDERQQTSLFVGEKTAVLFVGEKTALVYHL